MGIICTKDDTYPDYCCIIPNKLQQYNESANKSQQYNELININYSYLNDNFLSDDSDIESPKEIIFFKSFK